MPEMTGTVLERRVDSLVTFLIERFPGEAKDVKWEEGLTKLGLDSGRLNFIVLPGGLGGEHVLVYQARDGEPDLESRYNSGLIARLYCQPNQTSVPGSDNAFNYYVACLEAELAGEPAPSRTQRPGDRCRGRGPDRPKRYR